MSWLKHKSFFCKDVGFLSEFTYLVGKMLNVLILMFSSLSVSWMTVTCWHQFKGQPGPVRDSHLLKTRGISPFLSISICLSFSPNHAIPLLCHTGFGPMSISTSTWLSGGSTWSRMGPVRKKSAILFWLKGVNVSSLHLLRPYAPLMQGCWPKPKVVNHINLST